MIALWNLRDMFVIFFGGLLSLFLAAYYFSIIPFVPVALFLILTITFPNGSTILAYIKVLSKFLMVTQQVYFWR